MFLLKSAIIILLGDHIIYNNGILRATDPHKINKKDIYQICK